VNFTVNDVDDPLSNLVVTASVSTSSLGSVVVGGSGAARNLTYTPLGLTGTNRVSVMVSDGPNVVTNAFNVIVVIGTNYPPTLAATSLGGQLLITLTGSPDASYGLLTSPDLKTWTDAGMTITAGASGVATTTIPLPAARYTFARTYVK